MHELLWNAEPETPRTILCLGAHSDDLEIGCGGALLKWCAENPNLDVHWAVFSAHGARAREAKTSAGKFLRRAKSRNLHFHDFRDGFFPHEGGRLKAAFEELKGRVSPDLILTHHRHDRHQDHRMVCELTWNTWRNHLVLEYEIPKYDADLGKPNVFVPLSKAQCKRKIALLTASFPSQRGRQWFDEETFGSLLRLRGLECNSPTRYAEAFHAEKLVLR